MTALYHAVCFSDNGPQRVTETAITDKSAQEQLALPENCNAIQNMDR